MIEIEFKPKVLLRSADTRSELTFQVREELITAEIDSTEPPPGSGPRSGT